MWRLCFNVILPMLLLAIYTAPLLAGATDAGFTVRSKKNPTSIFTLPGAGKDPVVASLGNDRFLIVGKTQAHIWDGRARRAIPVKNTGQWRTVIGIAVGKKVLLVGTAATTDNFSNTRTKNNWVPDYILYDPKTQTGFNGKLRAARIGYRLVALSDHQVLIVGGWTPSKVRRGWSVELVSWSENKKPSVKMLSGLQEGRNRPGLALLKDGRVMAAGGRRFTSEIFDPSTQRWTMASSIAEDVIDPDLVRLSDGRVLLLRGPPQIWAPIDRKWKILDLLIPPGDSAIPVGKRYIFALWGNETRILDLKENKIWQGPMLQKTRVYARAVRLKNGEIHVIGGTSRGTEHQSVEVVNLTFPRAKKTGELQLSIGFTTAAALPNGRVLLAGDWGAKGGNPKNTVIVDPAYRHALYMKSRFYGVQPRGFTLPDGSVVVVETTQPKDKKRSRDKILKLFGQRWKPNTGTWSKVPALNMTSYSMGGYGTETAITQSTNGDLIFFSTSIEAKPIRFKVNNAYRWDYKTGKRIPLGNPLRWRKNFSVLELPDKRVAVIGGLSPAELIALEKNCRNCPDKYISLGNLQKTNTTEVFDHNTQTWRPGPNTHYTGGTAVRLKDGRIVNVTNTDFGVAIELSNTAFTQWTKKQPAQLIPKFRARKVVAVDNRVVILAGNLDPDHPGLIWNAKTDNWSLLQTKSAMPTDQILVINSKKLFLLGTLRTPISAVLGVYDTLELP